MLRQLSRSHIIILSGLMLAGATPAGAVVKGTSSSLSGYTVRLTGNGYCSGVAIARRAVATAAHCAHGMHVVAGGRSFRVTGVTRSAILDDGRNVSVSGDAAILKLSSPLPGNISSAPVGEGSGDMFTIAGYGTTDERWRGSFGSLHEATLIAAEPRALIDPNRTGSIGASACFGDSGGPVMRGGMLVGIITRAAHPSPRIACGRLTRWAPITASGDAGAAAVAEPAPHKQRRHGKRVQAVETSSGNWFANWIKPKVEARRVSRHKQARR